MDAEVEHQLWADPPRTRVKLQFTTSTLDLGELPGILVPEFDDSVQIPVEGKLVLGSAEDVDIWLDHPSAAGRHGEVRFEMPALSAAVVEVQLK